MTIQGLRATTIERTLRDFCLSRPPVEVLVAIDMALHLGLVDQPSLDRLVVDAKGLPGALRLRRLAEVAAPAESPMETRLRWLLLEAGLPQPEVQTDLHDANDRFIGRADIYYPAARVVVEYDGGNHRERMISDDRRQNLLVNSGFRVLRFTAADVHQRAQVIEAQVRGALAALPVGGRSAPDARNIRLPSARLAPNVRLGRQ